ncbi:histone-lysine N-methyltransferase PRDM9-like, partial [Anoplophora glabripennis]|uniref:histone-lysine N-methyltransferase PRDM9-like n=1 Tax=Anoplophora glabripennis TaxID=217634 RepID=UPI000874522A
MCNLITDEEVENFILKFLTKQKWEELGDIVKTRYRNMTRNYLSVPKDQNIMPLPDYICKPAYNKPNLHPKSTVKARNVESVEKVEPKVPIRKNPKRNVTQVNYYEEAEPGEDRYVFCDNCGEEYLDYCSKCGVLKSLLDFPVPLGTEDRAKKTAPKGVLEVRPSKVHGFGVFASRHVRKGIQMGPYQGEITRVDTTNGYCWKLRDGRLIDGADETRSNWLRYVNCAKNVAEQNVIAFQYNGQIYYRTCRDVEKGEELLVYYGKSFAEVLGINTKKYFEPNSEEVDSEYYCCEFCKVGLSTRAYRDTHEKYCRFRPNRMVLCSKDDNFVCQFCECTLTKDEFLKKHEVYCRKNPKR